MQVSPEILSQIKKRKAAIDQQELILSALKLELSAYIQLTCGIDITKESYTLDLEEGTLEKYA